MITVNIRFPESVHGKLVKYKKAEKPHMSLNALVVEAIVEKIQSEKDPVKQEA